MTKKLELRNIKYSASLSEETYAYTARLYVDGKPFADVSNHGTGGPDMQHPIAPFTRADIDKLEAWIGDNLPGIDMSKYGMEPLKMSIETWCQERVTDSLVAKDLQRALKRKVLYIEDGKVWETKSMVAAAVPHAVEMIKNKNPARVILNSLPFEDALSLYRKHGG